MTDPLSLIRSKFPFLTEEDIAAVVRLASMRTVSAGEHLIRAGTVNYNGFLVVKGLLRNYHVLPNGSERTVLFTAEGGSVASYASVLRNMPTVEQVTALEETLVLVIDVRELRNLMDSSPELMRAYAQVIEQLLLDAITRIDRFVLLSPEERYFTFTKEHAGLEQRIPQKHLASYLGITPVSLSRIRARSVQ
jgi:CRP-like cAMP-binding protein